MLRRIALLGSDRGWTFDLGLPLWSLTREWRISIILLLRLRRPLVLVGTTMALPVGLGRLGYVEAPVILGPNIAYSLFASAYFLFPFAAGAAVEGWRADVIPTLAVCDSCWEFPRGAVRDSPW